MITRQQLITKNWKRGHNCQKWTQIIPKLTHIIKPKTLCQVSKPSLKYVFQLHINKHALQHMEEIYQYIWRSCALFWLWKLNEVLLFQSRSLVFTILENCFLARILIIGHWYIILSFQSWDIYRSLLEYRKYGLAHMICKLCHITYI